MRNTRRNNKQNKTKKHFSVLKSTYDVVIVGGGIAGLNSAYELLKSQPELKILLCEKYKNLGGRVQTKEIKSNGKTFMVEAGAGRFHMNQSLILKLIHELGLDSKIHKLTGENVFYNIHHTEPTNDTQMLINRVIKYSKTMSDIQLQNSSFLDIATKVLNKEEVQYVIDSFGYYSEIVIMNAKDAIHLMTKDLSSKLQFCVLKGGLSQIVEKLHDKLANKVDFMYDTEIVAINKGYDGEFRLKTNQQKIIIGKSCICALPRPALQKITIFRPLMPLLKQVECSPLCRIYSVFKDNWNQGLPKITTNNNLRMIIPIQSDSDGTTVAMVSYTDNKFARFWKRLLDRAKGTYDLVNNEIRRLTEETTSIIISKPVSTVMYYWECGVGYWAIGADSATVASAMIQPFSGLPIFICGENFSEKHQQWIEGAIDTSNHAVKAFRKFYKKND